MTLNFAAKLIKSSQICLQLNVIEMEHRKGTTFLQNLL